MVRGESFDEQPMPDLDSEALDVRAASESFASVRRLLSGRAAMSCGAELTRSGTIRGRYSELTGHPLV